MNAARFCCEAAFNERLKVRLVDGDAAPTNEAPSPIAMLTSSNVLSLLRLRRIGAGYPNQRDFDSTCWLSRRPVGMPKPYSQDLRDRVLMRWQGAQ
jgi:hypothetical protein